MSVSKRPIAGRGRVRVSINGGAKELQVEAGRSLLSTLNSQGIFIPSACGGSGSCGLCKLAVKSGAGEHAPAEPAWITDTDRAAGIRLACQLKVERDLEILVPEELFSIRQYRARVDSLRDLTYDIKELTLSLQDGRELDFRAGGYIQLVVPAYALTPEPAYRAYSIASAPSRKKSIELEVRLVPNGICSTYVFQHLKPGDELMINGPFGDFHLRDGDREIVFVAGGSGMAPVKSILLDMVDRRIRRKVTYFFAAHSARDLFLVEEMRALADRLPGFRFIPALSNPAPEDRWEGEKGLITEVLNRHFHRLDRHEAYLCGSPGMVDASIRVLKSKGLPEDLIFYDKFA